MKIKTIEDARAFIQEVKIRVEPWTTPELRKAVIFETGCTKSQVDTALKNLQISLNVVREPAAEQDPWLSFQEVYTAIWSRHVPDEP